MFSVGVGGILKESCVAYKGVSRQACGSGLIDTYMDTYSGMIDTYMDTYSGMIDTYMDT
jgi:hypothetical protein